MDTCKSKKILKYILLYTLIPSADKMLNDNSVFSSVNDELPSGDSTVEFLINELKSLQYVS